ncbi:hypothetical protein ACFPC0_10885 [Streptomyces andamanensis]|uniref:Uncharacterized protein n=1 Tax=Streptomyces andamanensis TaxID=1565035 RepID=A0ABV8TCI1_9ACTN
MDTALDHLLPEEDPAVLREQALEHEAAIRRLSKTLHDSGQWEARCALRDAADLVLRAARSLAADGRPHPASAPHYPLRAAR